MTGDDGYDGHDDDDDDGCRYHGNQFLIVVMIVTLLILRTNTPTSVLS